MPATDDTYSIPSGADLYAGRDAPQDSPLSAQQIVADGVWTWFSDRRAIYRNGSTYFMYVRSNGDVAIARYVHATATVSEFTLSPTLEVNDHNNGAMCFLPDGRILACYSKHNDSSGTRYRISTNPEDIGAWGSEVVLTITTPGSYSNPYYLSQSGKAYMHYRSGVGGAGTNPINCRAYDATAGTWDAQRTWITNTGTRPYVKSWGNGVDRIDFLFTDRHPNQGQSSVYHAYMQLDGSNNEVWYESDGTEIGAGPITPAQATLVYDGSTNRAWVWDIVSKDGVIHALFADVQDTADHRARYAKCVGGVWGASVEVAPMGRFIYSAEPYYSGGCCFDPQDPTKVFNSRRIGAVEDNAAWELAEHSTSDGGASWSKMRDITSGSGGNAVKNCRPIGVVGHRGGIRALWFNGAYTGYQDFGSNIRGVG